MKADRQFPEVERLSVDETRRRIASGRAVLVDVRRADAYIGGHIPGAISLPARAIVARAHALPRDLDPILY